jgi:hypothetical protein
MDNNMRQVFHIQEVECPKQPAVMTATINRKAGSDSHLPRFFSVSCSRKQQERSCKSKLSEKCVSHHCTSLRCFALINSCFSQIVEVAPAGFAVISLPFARSCTITLQSVSRSEFACPDPQTLKAHLRRTASVSFALRHPRGRQAPVQAGSTS